ncbi:MAG: tetratricopeptide repeat protein [Crocosphaera sp.]
MALETSLKLNSENNRNYQKLLSVIEASENTLSLFIAVCDDRHLRNKIIEAYERELSPNIESYHIRIAQNEPSLKAAIYKIVQSEDFKNNQKNVLLTITGAEDLLFIHHQGEKSQQDKFFGYLQWTREGLREFHYPIVLWITNQILVNLSRKAPDFWSWRKGVFHFIPEPSLMTVLQTDNRGVSYDNLGETYSDSLSLEDLEELIANTEEKRGKNDPNLVTLYNRLGDIYFNQIRSGNSVNFPDEKGKALGSYYQALDISREIGDRNGEASSYNNLGLAYYSLGEYQQAIQYYQQSLAITTEIGAAEGTRSARNGEASSYNNLGNAYSSLGEYQQAIQYHQQSLAIKTEIGDRKGEASSYGNLGNVYSSLGQYQQAIQYHQQSLAITTEIGDRQGEGNTWFNLGLSFTNLQRNDEAREAFDNARQLYQDMGLNQMVERCDNEINALVSDVSPLSQ